MMDTEELFEAGREALDDREETIEVPVRRSTRRKLEEVAEQNDVSIGEAGALVLDYAEREDLDFVVAVPQELAGTGREAARPVE